MRENLKKTSFLSPANSAFVAEIYEKYLKNPASVDQTWRDYFAGVGDNLSTIAEDFHGASWSNGSRPKVVGTAVEEIKTSPATEAERRKQRDPRVDSLSALMLIRAYRANGHFLANLDPLGMEVKDAHLELDPTAYGFELKDATKTKEIFLGGELGLEKATLAEILHILKETYCGTIGFEFSHIGSAEQKDWLQKKIEASNGRPSYSLEQKKAILQKIIEVEGFEQFCHIKYPGTKRFSIEGAESVASAMEEVIHTSSGLGIQEIVVGMAHRGRLNVLTAIMGKPYAAMLSEFQGNLAFPEDMNISGDVKYHLGTSSDRIIDGRKVHLSLTANPSHLECVNPVVVGKVRAKQDQLQDAERAKVMGILLHGDAAFAGQGVVAETIELGDLKGYTTGGTIHIIVNNQIGFTTSPKNARLSPYPTDVAKIVQAPIFHVNGDDPEAVAFISRIAAEFRQEFKKDVVIDVFCYRRYGHNEGDEPSFTQPLMYQNINNHPTPREVYAEKLISEGTVSQDEFESMKQKWSDYLEAQLAAAQSYKPNKADWLEGKWVGFKKPEGFSQVDTGVALKTLKEIGKVISTPPKDFNVHPKIVKQLEVKAKMFETGDGLDWATAEALAFGSLLREGVPVRLSGQDSRRGTFSQRHSVLVDQQTEADYIPLNNLGKQASFEVIDSNLSEFAVMGFEYGYSMAEPKSLVLWEGQFGDFANGAQVIIDQFIASGEVKWLRMSGLVLLLPHGYEGQGPEHSSARLERFLQLCAEDNMQVANCTTPASYFHILRRQIVRDFRKPLIIMTPKSLLRHKLAQSRLDEFGPGTTFRTIIPEGEGLVADSKIRKVVICSGKVYYDLFEARHEKKINDVAILRMEQFYPFPAGELAAEIKRYKNASEVIWCQEEPKNMGGWTFVNPFIEEVLVNAKAKAQRPVYAGRKAAASPAAGYMKLHTKEQKELVEAALS